MSDRLQPATLEELAAAVRGTSKVIAVGANTKPRLTAVDATPLYLTRLSGLTEYEPSEFTFTAMAGTPVREITAALAERGQYLPFDPMLVAAGATIGGTVASGLSGPGRFRFGGVRDFILGVLFVDGEGRLLRTGGKVVKNAAGFDLPKFFVGSLGRFGVLAQVTFKVFPWPANSLTLRIPVEGDVAAAQILMQAGNTRWEPAALDILPDARNVALRLEGPASAIEAISREVKLRWPADVLPGADAQALWTGLGEFSWAHENGPLVKAAITPSKWPALAGKLRAIEGTRVHVSAGGNQMFISTPSSASLRPLDTALSQESVSGVTLRGNGELWPGRRELSRIHGDLKVALDSANRFPSLDD